MEQRFVSAYNESSKRFLGSSLAVVDSAKEPIKVLKILMEGLAPEDEAGLWLINFRGVPVARSHTPFDLAYLDEDERIIQAVEITQTSRFVPFKGSPASALILPPRALSASGTFTGDHILFRKVDSSEADRPQPHPQPGSGIFSRIVRATMVKNFNVPDEQAVAPRSGPLMRSARSLSIKPPAPSAQELEHDRLAARVAAATADTSSDTPPSVQWVSKAPPTKAPAPEPASIAPPARVAPPIPPQEIAPPPPMPASLSSPAIEHVAEAAAVETAVPIPAAMPFELESIRADVAPELEQVVENISVESPQKESVAEPETAAPVPVQTSASFHTVPTVEPESAIPTSPELAPNLPSPPAFTPSPIVPPDKIEPFPAAAALSEPKFETPAAPSYSVREAPAAPIASPAPKAEPPQPAFDIEAFRREASLAQAPLPPAPVPSEPISNAPIPQATFEPAEPTHAAPPPRPAESRTEVRNQVPADDLPAPVYAWTGMPAAQTPPPAAPLPPPEVSASAAPVPEPEPESSEDPVSRDVAILISSNVALAATLPFVVLASPQSILYSEHVETPRDDEEDESEEAAPQEEPLYLRTIERKPATPSDIPSPRRAPEMGRPEPQRELEEPEKSAAVAPEKKRPEPPLELPQRPARTITRPQRMMPAVDEESLSSARPGPNAPAPPEAAATSPSPSRVREPIQPTPREMPLRTQPAAAQPERPASRRPRYVEPVVPPPSERPASKRPRFVEPTVPPQSALAPIPEPPRPEPPPRPHPAPISPETSHVIQQEPAPPTPPPPPSLAKMARRWDVKLLYSLFPDLRPDYRPELEQPVVNFTKDAGHTQEEDSQTRRMRVLNWLYPDLHLDTVKKRQREVRRAPRIPVPGLVGYFFTGGKSEPHEILNISVMGFYMKTSQRWMPGTVIRITLQMIDSDGTNPTDSITVLSRVVNWDNDGGGFEFVLPGLID